MRLNHAVWMLLPVCGLVGGPAAWAASEPRYTYAEVGYVNADFDDIDEDGDGFAFGGSLAVHPNVHLLAEYRDIDLDGNADFNRLELGVGVNYPLRSGLDLIGRVRWIDQEIDIGPRNRDDDGYGLEAGMRTMINPLLELNGGIEYEDLDDEDDTLLYIGALYDVLPNFALGGEIEFSDDVTALILRARLYFGSPVRRR